MRLCHETIQLEQVLPVPPARAFAAYLNKADREIWSAPSATAAVIIDNADVRTGGSEATRCGGKNDLRFRTEVRYHRVEANAYLCFSETLYEGDAVLTAALITFDFRAEGDEQTCLILTDQVTSFVGPEALTGHRQGFAASLQNFRNFLNI
ncbi:SRPBCC domain-containing protein [Asticcacaulis sp.]|uniref:SRPBCC domain-containing protein n=1 Tax=Asticcacaulis sp. TaxID=1872648 RepID=UPI0026275E68|nr:SRPBCC domain-containing protein [Asticcacaulis sp.]